jgi:hypothetical protein
MMTPVGTVKDFKCFEYSGPTGTGRNSSLWLAPHATHITGGGATAAGGGDP